MKNRFFTSVRLWSLANCGGNVLWLVILTTFLILLGELVSSQASQLRESAERDGNGRIIQSLPPRVLYLVTLERGELECGSKAAEAVIGSSFPQAIVLGTSALIDENGLNIEVTEGEFLQLSRNSKGEFDVGAYAVVRLNSGERSQSVLYQGYDLSAATKVMNSNFELKDWGRTLLVFDQFEWSMVSSNGQTLDKIGVLRSINLFTQTADYSGSLVCSARYAGTATAVGERRTLIISQ